MFSNLKDHPFAVEAHFDSSLVLTYAVPLEALKPLVPECLAVDDLNGQWGFVAAAMVKTRNLRPKNWPAFMGNDFFLAGYRIFVRYKTSSGKRLRGLYILRSETDKRKMAVLGNIFTHYNYHHTDIDLSREFNQLSINSLKSGLQIRVKTGEADVALPANSPFKDWKEARRFAGPLPFTFTFSSETKQVLIIEGVRNNWVPEPVEVLEDKVGFLNRPEFKDAVLANAFIVQDIPYYWKKGKTDQWKP